MKAGTVRRDLGAAMVWFCWCWAMAGFAAEPVAAPRFTRDILPVLQANCVGCHRLGKLKGGLDLSTHAGLMRGGKSGPSLVAGQAGKSLIIEQISGAEPEMPKDADPLTPTEIERIRLWIDQGAVDESTSDSEAERPANAVPVYLALPAIPAMAWSPSGQELAVAGWHEVLIHDVGTTQVVARLAGASSRIEALAYSEDGARLAVAGGSPSRFGEVQVWDVGRRRLLQSIRATSDTLFGVAFSPDGRRVAAGGTDKLVRVFSVEDGREAMRCDNHIDWVLGTAFTRDGTRLVSAGKDKSLKLIDVTTGRLVDDVNRPNEVLSCLAGSPRENLVLAGSETGGLRLYRMEPRGGRLAEGDDKENGFVREFERLPGPVHAVAFSRDGSRVAATGGGSETRIFQVTDGRRLATLRSSGGPSFAVAFSTDGGRVVTGGADGKLRMYVLPKGDLVAEWGAVPVGPAR